MPRIGVKTAEKTHPSFQKMTLDAVVGLKKRTPVSSAAIRKYVLANYEVKEEAAKRFLRFGLKKNVEAGYLEKVAASFKLTKEGRESLAPKKKKAAPKKKKKIAAKPKKPATTTTATTTKKKSTTVTTKKKAPASPKKKKTTTTTVTKKKVPASPKKKTTVAAEDSRPSYIQMVLASCVALGATRKPVSATAIRKYCLSNFDLPESSKRYIRVALKKGSDEALLLKFAASFKMTPEGRKELAKLQKGSTAKKVTKPAAKKKTTTSTAAAGGGKKKATAAAGKKKAASGTKKAATTKKKTVAKKN